jgi:uncharacterized OB-fold protein
MSTVPIYPQPTVTATNRQLIEAWQRGELVLQHCTACAAIVFFPREMCPRCWCARLDWRKHSGRGRIVSYSRVYSHVTEPFVKESPITLAEIVLDDGGAMLARVVAGEPDVIADSAAVELVPMPEAARYTLPTFRLIPKA